MAIRVGQKHHVVLQRSDRGSDLTGVVGNCRVFIREGSAHFNDAKPGEKWVVRLTEEFGLRRGLFVGVLEALSDEPLNDRDLIQSETFPLTFVRDGTNGLHGIHRGFICKLSRDWWGSEPEVGDTVEVRMRAWAQEENTVYVIQV